ncbi:MAG: hypothetical protein CM1200mP41_15200 [Gammaproteobacteria bacterium]|nr:MAG: hypothetical protein CM1200mP41_15200 [Gammaproteobacteria bacterium]
MLVLALGDMPRLSRGKGVKLINIPPARYRAKEEWFVARLFFKRAMY